MALPQQIDQKVALCNDHKSPSVCVNVTVCFNVTSRHYKGVIGSVLFGWNALHFVQSKTVSEVPLVPPFSELHYNLTADLLHKPSFSHRFYFHGNGSSDSTRGRVRARAGQLACTTHVAYQKVTTFAPASTERVSPRW